jgi:hypothetical protein
VFLDLDSLHERAHELTPRLPIGVLQSSAHLSGKLFQVADEQAELAFDLGLLLKSLHIPFQPDNAFAEAGDAWLKLRRVNQALRRAIDQASNSPTEPGQGCLRLVAILWR